MKILFLHLSDAHLKDALNDSIININKMLDAIAQVGHFDECLIVFSGDIAHAGQSGSYCVAKQLIEKIKIGINEKFIKNKKIEVLIVPGNHDNFIKNKNRNAIELEQYYKEKQVDMKFKEDLLELDAFYEFANSQDCFIENKIIDVKKIQFGDFIIKVNLINTSPFSLLGGNNQDKGKHYLSHDAFEQFNIDMGQQYTMSVMHHSPEWFADECKNKLYKNLYQATDLLFVGHEHNSLSEDKKVNGNHIDISSGLALYGDGVENGFNTLILDTDAHSLVCKKFIYNGYMYNHKQTIENKNVIFRYGNNFKMTEEFWEELSIAKYQGQESKYMDYFVFPYLEENKISSDLKNNSIESVEQFITLMDMHKKICLKGDDNSGKTVLSKYLTHFLSKRFIILYLTGAEFQTKKIKNIVKNAIEYEYGEDTNIDEFSQMKSETKILIVDDFDKIQKEKWENFIHEFDGQFKNIIIFSNNNWSIDIKSKVIEEFDENPFCLMKICPFYYKKREKLIRKIYKSNAKDINEEDIQKINDEISSQLQYYQLIPDIIHQYTDYYINHSISELKNTNNSFCKIFVENISHKILINLNNNVDLNEMLISLDYIAYYIHFIKKEPYITFNEFEAALNLYKIQYDNDAIVAKQVYDIAICSNILRNSKETLGVSFVDNAILSYFVARHLNRKLQNDSSMDELKELLNQICFGNNGDIILFLSFITENTKILQAILAGAYEHMGSWVELDLDSKNVQYLFDTNDINIVQNLHIQEYKQIYKNSMDLAEQEFIESSGEKCANPYEYDVLKINSFENRIITSVKYLELISKMLPNFRHVLTKDEKEQIVNMIYTYPNKLLYFVLSHIDANYKENVEELAKIGIKTKDGKPVTQEIIEKTIKNISIAYMLILYDCLSSTASTSKTIVDFEKFEFNKTTTYKLQNLLILENVDSFKKFAVRAERLYEETNDNVIKQMILIIIKKYFIDHHVDLYGDASRLIDKTFGAQNRKFFNLLQAKNSIVKK